MKQLIIILLLSSATVAQPLQGIIYNFEIGDVLETKYTAYGSVAAYTEYRLDTIISKQIAGDTITYTMNRYKLGISQSGSNYNQSIESLVTVVLAFQLPTQATLDNVVKILGIEKPFLIHVI